MYNITVQRVGADIIKALVSTGMTAVPTGDGNTQTVAVGSWGCPLIDSMYFIIFRLYNQFSSFSQRK